MGHPSSPSPCPEDYCIFPALAQFEYLSDERQRIYSDAIARRQFGRPPPRSSARPAGQTAAYLPAERCSIGRSSTPWWHTSDPPARPPWVQSALRVCSSLDSHTPRTVWTHLQQCAHCPPWKVPF